jgi:hypothetical protein
LSYAHQSSGDLGTACVIQRPLSQCSSKRFLLSCTESQLAASETHEGLNLRFSKIYPFKFEMLRRSQEYSNLRSSSEKDEEDCLEGSEERQNDRTISYYLHRWHSTLQKSLICIYGGWILSAWLLVVFITSSWINHGYDDRKCFDSTASYCEFSTPFHDWLHLTSNFSADY